VPAVLRIGVPYLKPGITRRWHRVCEYPTRKTKAHDLDHVHVGVEELALPLRCQEIVPDRPADGRGLSMLIEEIELLGRRGDAGFAQQEVKERQMLGGRPQRHITAARCRINPLCQFPGISRRHLGDHNSASLEHLLEPRSVHGHVVHDWSPDLVSPWVFARAHHLPRCQARWPVAWDSRHLLALPSEAAHCRAA
jgi:hypothetical protein